jgi:type IV pilus assembly protein PilP
MILRYHGWAILAGTAVILGGCGFSGEDELQGWMTHLRATTKPYVTPLAAPKDFVPESYPESYTAANSIVKDPFDPRKLMDAIRRDTPRDSAGDALIEAEKKRRKEPLEAFPLDAITMVGSMNKTGVPTALVNVNKLLYQVRIGSYLGQNYGKVVGITETNMQLREVVQDSSGNWVERITALELQEGKGVKK